jgi:hypothetical protein
LKTARVNRHGDADAPGDAPICHRDDRVDTSDQRSAVAPLDFLGNLGQTTEVAPWCEPELTFGYS